MKDFQRDELRAELQSKIDALKKTVSTCIQYLCEIGCQHVMSNSTNCKTLAVKNTFIQEKLLEQYLTINPELALIGF